MTATATRELTRILESLCAIVPPVTVKVWYRSGGFLTGTPTFHSSKAITGLRTFALNDGQRDRIVALDRVVMITTRSGSPIWRELDPITKTGVDT